MNNLKETLFVRFSQSDQGLFAKRLSFLIKANVPLVDSLQLIREQTKSRVKARVYDAIIADVSSGQQLAGALQRHRRLFGDFSIHLIAVGEHSGALSQNLSYLADELHKKQLLRRKIVGALLYPACITVATLGLTALLTAYIFPKLMPIFVSLHVDLPATTRAMIATSAYLRDFGIYTLLGFTALCIAFAMARAKYERVRYASDACSIRVPIVGSIARSYNLANFCRTLGLLLRSNITLEEAMHITAKTQPNLVYARATENIAGSVIKGEMISTGLARTRLFPDLLVHLVSIGETTGNLEDTLGYLAELYEGEVDERTKSLSSAIEPVLMLVMGALVGLIAVSVITPIYAITQHLQPK